MINFDHVSLRFQDKTIFHDLNLDIKKGERVSLIGGSGRGKTTLLKLVQGYLFPDSGTIKIYDEVLTSKSIHHLRKEMAWIPQNINLPVSKGIELMRLMDITDKSTSISIFLEELGLNASIIHDDFSKISGGQKQRIVISIVLSLDKSIILLDEPTSSLDDKSIKMLLKVMKSLENKTIVSASHNQVWNNQADKVIEL